MKEFFKKFWRNFKCGIGYHCFKTDAYDEICPNCGICRNGLLD